MKALKRARYEKPYEYKRKSNQDQAAFNAKVDEAVAEAEHQIEEAGPSTAPALERAKEALKKGRQFISRRKRALRSRPAAARCPCQLPLRASQPRPTIFRARYEAIHQHDGANTSAQSGGPLLRVWRDGPHAHELSEGSCP